ncbi:hypothetical protein KW784_01930 [Candidatus Parcubacteria bacterium]|nr:hypothetical protein [Candidatus Parcubacteria bacterium]
MSSFSIGQMNQFGDALEAVGGNAKHLTRLGQSPTVLENLLKVLDGEATFQVNHIVEPVATAFERNEHGHVVLTFAGLDLAGAAEVDRLQKAGFRVSDWAKSCLLSTKKDGYDKHHRLESGREYKVALMPGKEIGSDRERTTANLRKRGMEHYGYGKPFAGLVPRIRETLSDKQMEELGIWYAAALHDPISDSDGDPGVLRADRGGDGSWVGAGWGGPGNQWGDDGAFAFPLLAS